MSVNYQAGPASPPEHQFSPPAASKWCWLGNNTEPALIASERGWWWVRGDVWCVVLSSCRCRTRRSVTTAQSTALQVNAVPRQDLPPFWVIVMRPTSSVYKWVKDRNYLFLFVFSLFQSILKSYIVFRMRAKTSEFLKVLNRAKIEEENTKKKTSYMGNRGQFI